MAIEVVQGKITRVFNKPLDKPDMYENVTRLSVEVDIGKAEKVWVSLGAKKKDGLQVQGKDKKWVQVGAGSSVVITAERNGDFLNAKISDVKISELVGPSADAFPVSPLHPKPQAAGAAVWHTRDEDIKAGMQFNKAVDLAIANSQGKGVTKQDIVAAFRVLQETYDECRAPPPQPPLPPRAVTQRDVAPDVDFDDEVPF
jgi:hypothetical protein